MRALVTKFLALLLLAPAAFGCCWHSLLACQRAATLECSVALSPSKCEHCCEHCAPQHSPAKPGKFKVECKGKSVYLPVSKAQANPSQIVLPLGILPEHVQLVGRQAAATTLWDLSLGQCDVHPPVRLHALNCSFLI